MKLLSTIVFLSINSVLYAQDQWRKIEEVTTREISVNCSGLDDLVLKNSTDNFLRISLDNKSSDNYVIDTRQIYDTTEIFYQFEEKSFIEDGVFRKFITRRMNNVSTIIEVPEGKSIVIHGESLGVKSESYKGDLSVYIKTGNIYLYKIEGVCKISFYQGNLYTSSSGLNLNIISNKGAIVSNGRSLESPVFQEKGTTKKQLNVQTILGNIFINSSNQPHTSK